MSGRIHGGLLQVPFDNLEDAMQAVKLGKVMGVLHFPANFSESYQSRLERGASTDDYAVDSSQIEAFLDMSSR